MGGQTPLPEPPGLTGPFVGDSFCPTFSIDAPSICSTPTKSTFRGGRASVFDTSEVELSFDSSVYGPAPRVFGPGGAGPYREPRPGPISNKMGSGKGDAVGVESSPLIRQVIESVGQQQADMANLATASANAVGELQQNITTTVHDIAQQQRQKIIHQQRVAAEHSVSNVSATVAASQQKKRASST